MWTLGIDIGGTKVAAALVDPEGRAHYYRTVPTLPQDGPDRLLDRIVALARQVIQEGQAPPVAVGIGTGGQVNPQTGEILYATDLIPGWAGAPLRVRVEGALGLPTWVINDVHAMALAEAVHGAGRDVRWGLFVAVGTGIGGAWVLNGQLVHGHRGLAGAVGHVKVERDGRRCTCGGAGCVEQYASGPAIAARYRALRGLEEAPSGVEVADAARQGDALARLAVREAGEWLGFALASLVNAAAPEAIIIGGGVLGFGEMFLDAVRWGLERDALPSAKTTPVLPAALGPAAGVIGAGVLARQRWTAQHRHENLAEEA
ncbi:MAG: ROK family glucokinase [Anaerolineae bacterium]